jgi:hypothetical protein
MCILFSYPMKSYILTTCDSYIPSLALRYIGLQIFKSTSTSASESVVQCAIANIYLVQELTTPAVSLLLSKYDKIRTNLQLFLLYAAQLKSTKIGKELLVGKFCDSDCSTICSHGS